MTFSPLPPYFIVKINKETQSARRDKIGSLYLHFQEIYMQRNIQNGEIVAIGEDAKKIFPDCKIGNTALFHHFVEGSASDKSNLIHSDDTDNYYFITTSEFNGHRNETYGIYNGTEIIPHPDFVFIKNEEIKKEETISHEDYIKKNTTKIGSLILFNNWEETREEKEEKASTLMTEIKNQSKGKSMSDSTKRALEVKQREAETITSNLNRKEYKSFEIEYSNPSLKIKEKAEIFALSISANTEFEFLDKKYKIVAVKYCAATA